MSRVKGAVKKGRRSWDTTDMLAVHNKEDGFVYRWERNDSTQIERQKSLGWEVVSDNNSRAVHESEADGGKPVDTTKTFRELILMRLPQEDAQERRDYFKERADEQVRGLKREAQRDMDRLGNDAKVRGSILIE